MFTYPVGLLSSKVEEKILITMDMSTPSTAGINLTFTGSLNIDWKEGGGLVPFVSGVELTYTYTTPATYIAEITGDLENITQFIADNSKITFISDLKTGLLTSFAIQGNLYSGTLDMSLAPVSGLVSTSSNSGLTGITFASSGNGTVTSFQLYNCGLIGNLDLSNVPISTLFDAYSNSGLTSITFASSGNSIVTNFRVYSCNLTGTLDLTNVPISTNFRAYSNTNLTGITFATSGNSTVTTFRVYLVGIVGNLDLSNVPIGGTFLMFTVPLMTGITFASSGNSIVTAGGVYICAGLTALDLTNVPTRGSLNFNNNTILTGIIFSASGNGIINAFNFYTSNYDYIDLTNHSIAVNNSALRFENCSMIVDDVNHILVDLYSLVSGEGGGGDYTGRTINISGTNAAPDGSSGGYDGTQAVIDLTAKGISVTTS